MKQYFKNIYFRRYYNVNVKKNGPVFVVGTGRSGTHFLTSCLNEFPDLDDCFGGGESPFMFEEITSLTVNNRALTKAVIGYYEKMIDKVAPRMLVDQTHPNIWHVEQLLEHFPEAKFLALSRNVYSVVYSMKQHRGVSKWTTQHNRWPKPNRFLGVNHANRELYQTHLTDLQRNVFRWCAHESRIRRLVSNYPESVKRIEYEGLSQNMRVAIAEIAKFLGVDGPKHFKAFNSASLDKKNKLTNEEKEEIKSALNWYGMHLQEADVDRSSAAPGREDAEFKAS